jgi:hypothetical protein
MSTQYPRFVQVLQTGVRRILVGLTWWHVTVQMGQGEQTPLIHATCNDNIAMVEYLVHQGADVNAAMRVSFSAIFLTAWRFC